MNQNDFKDWKSSPITKALFVALQRNIEGLQIELGYIAGVDQRLDAIKVGAIQAYRDVLEADWFEETEV
jgi:hypothetical protein